MLRWTSLFYDEDRALEYLEENRHRLGLGPDDLAALELYEADIRGRGRAIDLLPTDDPINLELPAHLYDEVVETASKSLKEHGFSIASYKAAFAGVDAFSYRLLDADTLRDRVNDRLQSQTSLHISLKEPRDDDGYPSFDTDIAYCSSDTEGFFVVRNGQELPAEDRDEADRWRAGIERALLDAGFPVMLGDVDHEDNVPVTKDTFYGE